MEKPIQSLVAYCSAYTRLYLDTGYDLLRNIYLLSSFDQENVISIISPYAHDIYCISYRFPSDQFVRVMEWGQDTDTKLLSIIRNGCLLNGYRVGLWSYWYENGNLQSIAYLKDGKRIKYWRHWRYWRTYHLMDIFTEGLYSGYLFVWHFSGKLHLKGNYEDGKRIGYWLEQDQFVTSKGNYKNGKKVGRWHYCGYWGYWSLQSGEKMTSEGNYVNGIRTGRWQTWYNTGQLESEGDYADDRQVGHWIYWNKDGTLHEEYDL